MTLSHFKKGDTIVVIAGKDREKRGKVLEVYPKDQTVIVEGLNRVKKHMKPSPSFPTGGIVIREAPLHWSKVMLVCPHCNKATRIGIKVLSERKVRICKKCGEIIDET
ncbi:MAG: 50S ribosomal protein L24 [bacterium]